MKKYTFRPSLFALCSLLTTYYLLLTTSAAHAFCPVCTVAVAAGVGLSRWLGVDDTISGLWVGALTVSMSLWTINWLTEKKYIKNFWWNPLIFVAYYIMVLLPFWKTDIISFHPSNLILGVDKILFGVLVGSAAFTIGYVVHLLLKEYHGGKSYFPYQKIVFSISPLIILAVIFYFITKR